MNPFRPPHTTLAYTYEPLGHRVEMDDNHSGSVYYAYDQAANLTDVTLQVG